MHLDIIKVNKNGLYYKLYALSNMIFYIVFKIYYPLLVLLCFYSILVYFFDPINPKFGSNNSDSSNNSYNSVNSIIYDHQFYYKKRLG